MCYVDHPDFLKYLKDRYEKDSKGKANGIKLSVTPYMRANKRGVMQEIAWNVVLPHADVKGLEKIAKQDKYKSERDLENERKAAAEKVAAKAAKKSEREAARLAAREAAKAERKRLKEEPKPKRTRKKAEPAEQLSLDI